MRSNTFKSRLMISAFAASVVLLASGASFAQQQINLTAGPAVATLPDGSTVPMWGYSCDATQVLGSTATCSALNPSGGWSPVVITVPTGAALQINLTNNLSFATSSTIPPATPPNNIPTSLVIVGQLGGGLGTTATSALSPVHAPLPNTWFVAGTTNGATFAPPTQGNRVQSFATEVNVVSPAAATALCWGTGCPVPTPALRPGTYPIESGTHPSIQGPMGLYGILVVTAAPTTTAGVTTPGTAYPGVSYDAEVPLLLSEIDPSQNNAVDSAVRTARFSETSARVVRDSIAAIAPTLDANKNPIAGSGYKVGDTLSFMKATACTVPPTAASVTAVSTTGAIQTIGFTGGQGCSDIPTATVNSLTGTGAQLTVALVLSSVGQCSGLADGTPVPACYPPAVNYTPLYYLINGVAFDRNNALASQFSTVPAMLPVHTRPGVPFNVLVRLVNAGLRMHVPSIVGSTTSMTGPLFPGLSLVAEDGNPVPGLTRVQSEVFMAAGKTYDVMVDEPPALSPALPIYDRELSLSGNAVSRDSGMLAYISVNGAALPSVSAAVAIANADTYNVIPTQALTVSNTAKGVIGNDVNVYNVRVSTPPTQGTVTLNADGTFTYTPCTLAIPACASWASDSFVYQANGGRGPTGSQLTATVTLTACTLANSCIEAGTGIVVSDTSYTSAMATFLQINPPGILSVDKDTKGFPLTVDLGPPTTVTPGPGLTLSVDANGGFKAIVPAAGTYTFTYQAKNSQGTQSASGGSGGAGNAGIATVTLIFPPANGPTVQVLDGADKTTVITDYRWIIEENRTFNADPVCALNPSSCPGGTPLAFGTNFHPSSMPVVATGCTGPLSCEGGQTSLGNPVVCDVGNGVCEADPNKVGHTPVLPTQASLDPNKRYYISIFPGDAANPFIGGNLSAPSNCPAGPYNLDGSLNTSCGHGMGGAAFKGQNASLMVLTQPSPYPTGKLTVFVFEDDFPLNGENGPGGGLDVIAPQEPGLGGFNIILFDAAGGSGDPTGQPTYDMFNQPLTNSLAGTIDPVTGNDACPISAKVTANALKNGPDPTHPKVNATPAQCSADPTLRGCQKGIVGMIVTCPNHESDGKTKSPLAGQAVIPNLYAGRYNVVATPGADRIARGEEWLQTNTLDGQKAHDAFVRIGEPAYFQEFGPAGYHVTIGFANPDIINSRRINSAKTGMCDPAPAGGGQACNNTITGMVTQARMSRTPDERLYSSGSRDGLAFTQCFVSLGDPDGADFAFAKCDAKGNFTFTGIPAGNWKATIFDQWNDQVVDGITAPVALKNAPPGGTTLNLGEIATHQWQINLYTRTFLDLNGNGVSDRDPVTGADLELGLALVPTNIRYRDGSFSNFNNTDLNGYAGFNEVFPLFNWYVVEADTTRFKSTGVHVVYDSGGPTDGLNSLGTSYCGPGAPCGPYNAASPYNNFTNTYEKNPLPANLSVPGAVYCTEATCANEKATFAAGGTIPSGANSTGRIDPPLWFGTYGFQGYSGQNNFLEFGKKPFVAGETGGIFGHVMYASTRPFDDPRFATQNSWVPLVPNVTVNLYKEGFAADGVTPTLILVDSTKTSSFDDWSQGFRKDAGGNIVVDALGNAIPNMNCPGQTLIDPFWSAMQGQPFYLDWYNATFNAGTLHTLPNKSQFKCYDGMHNWNQLQPAPYDGLYRFPSVTSLDPKSGKPTNSNCHMATSAEPWGCTTNPDTTDHYRLGTPMLPAGKYVVEVVPPSGFEVVKEEDKNILIGDQYIAPVNVQFPGLGSNIFILPDQAAVGSAFNPNNPQNPTNGLGQLEPFGGVDAQKTEEYAWPCVGASRVVPDFMSIFPLSGEVAPFAGATRNLCDRKEVTVTDQTASLAQFSLFTPVHIASHFTGQITDDFTAEFDPFSPQFGEKFAPSFLPVSVKDWAGNETSRTNADQFGVYNGLNYSTWEVDPPNPTGYAPTMMVVCMNDRGNFPDPAHPGMMMADPLYQPNYSQFCYELAFMPGQTGYFDTPVVPTSAFAEGYNHPDCNYSDATPAIASVTGGVAGPWVSAAGNTLTINALGDQQVENPAWAGPQAAAPFNVQKITRHYGFGGPGTVALVGSDGVAHPLTGVSWSDAVITGTVPSGVPNCAIQQQSQYGGSTAQCGQLVITTAAGKQSIDTVTVTIGGKTPTVLAAGQKIQPAIDAANPGDMIIVPPGVYNEFLLMWKPIRLQGVGAASSVVNANTHPAGKLDPWRRQAICLFGLALDGTPISAAHPYDPSAAFTCTPDMQFAVDRLPLEATVGWSAVLSGNLAEQLIEPTLLGAYEGAGITVLAKGVDFHGAYPWSDGTEVGAFPAATTLLRTADCIAPNGTNPFPSNFWCNPSSIDGLSVANSSQGGGGIMVHGWGHNIQIANNRVHNNQGTLSGGITVGMGEHPDIHQVGVTPTTNPGSCESAGVTNQGLPFCFDMNVNIHHNALTMNSSLGDELFSSTPAGAGGATINTGSDYYNFSNNWVCGNMSTGDGAGVAHLGYTKNGRIEHNSILFNQSTNPTITTNGGGLLVMGAPDVDPPCGLNSDKDCLSAPNLIPPSDGTGPGLVINANLILANSADSGSGGGLRLQHVNGTDALTFPNGRSSCSTLATCLWNTVSITNNIIANNVAGWDGAGVSLLDSLAVNFVNNTVVSNDATAASGVLFNSLFAPLASSPGTNCTVNSGAGSCPQVAGLVSVTNSAVLQANLPAVGFSCPLGHGDVSPGYAGADSCKYYSVPLLANNVIWQNRSFVIGIGPLGGGTTSQQNQVTIFNAPLTGPATVPASQTTTGQCPTTGSSYWDIGVRGDTGPVGHAGIPGGPTLKLAPTYSVLSSGDYTDPTNQASSPLLTSQYCNGSRSLPEICAGVSAGDCLGRIYTIPGTNEVNAWPSPVFSLTPSATVDEGNNWVNIRWGPLSLTKPTDPTTTLGNFRLTPGSHAIDAIPVAVGAALAPPNDYFGNPRPAGSGYDIGAVELQELSLSPALANFGNQAVLTTSPANVFTLNNPATGVQATGIAVSLTGTNAAEYAISANTCGTTLAAGAQCTISVTFRPSLLGTRTATLQVANNETAAPLTAALTGTGTGPLYSVNPSSLSFPNTVVATVSAPLSVTVRNNQTTSMSFTTRSLNGLFGGQYAIVTGTTTCVVGTPVASGGTCVINVTFNPQTVFGFGGIRPANLQLTASALTTNVGLSGTAILFPVDVTPKGFLGINGALLFPNTQVGQLSAPLIATLSNYQSSTSVTVNSITTASEFQIVNGPSTTCTSGSVLPPAATDGTPSTCTVAVEFAPNAQNLFFGFNFPWMQVVTFNLSGSPVNPTLTLVGTALNSAISGTTTFARQLVNTASTSHVFTYTNSGGVAIALTGVTLSGTNATNYAIASNTCSGAGTNPVPASGGTCQVGVTFTPSATGNRTATLTFTDAIGSQSVGLTGPGVLPTFSGTTGFGNVTIGSSVTRTFTLTNSASAGSATITAVPTLTAGQGFTIVTGAGTTCLNGAVLAAGGSCTFSIQFAPTSTGSKAATLSVTDTAGTQSVGLTGTGIARATASPLTIGFANTTLGSVSATTTVTLTNPAGNPTMTGIAIAFTGTNPTYFRRSTTTPGTCGTSLAANASCTIGVVFAPPAAGTAGAKSASMNISSTNVPDPSVTLSGGAL